MFHLSKFTLGDEPEEFEGYTDGSLWNGWAKTYFTREQLKKVFGTGYSIIFLEAKEYPNQKDYPIAILSDGLFFKEVIDSTPIGYDPKVGYIEMYSLEGYEFVEVEK